MRVIPVDCLLYVDQFYSDIANSRCPSLSKSRQLKMDDIRPVFKDTSDQHNDAESVIHAVGLAVIGWAGVYFALFFVCLSLICLLIISWISYLLVHVVCLNQSIIVTNATKTTAHPIVISSSNNNSNMTRIHSNAKPRYKSKTSNNSEILQYDVYLLVIYTHEFC